MSRLFCIFVFLFSSTEFLWAEEWPVEAELQMERSGQALNAASTRAERVDALREIQAIARAYPDSEGARDLAVLLNREAIIETGAAKMLEALTLIASGQQLNDPEVYAAIITPLIDVIGEMQQDGTLLGEAAIALDDAIGKLDKIAKESGLPTVSEVIDEVSGTSTGSTAANLLSNLANFAQLARDTPHLATMNAQQTKAYIDKYAAITGLSGPGYIAVRDLLAWDNEMYGQSALALDLVSRAIETGELDMESYNRINARLREMSTGPWGRDTVLDIANSICGNIPGLSAYCADIISSFRPESAADLGKCYSGSAQFPETALTPADISRDKYTLLQDPQAELAGNWIIRWSNSAELNTAYATLRNGASLACDPVLGCRYLPPESGALSWRMSQNIAEAGTDYYYGSDSGVNVSEGNQISVQYSYGIFGLWGGASHVSGNADRLVGQWQYGDAGGSEIWTRANARITTIGSFEDGSFLKVPAGNLITFSVPYEKFKAGYPYMRANMREKTFVLFGDNLWGDHTVWIPEGNGLTLDSQRYVCGNSTEDGYEFSNNGICSAPGKVSGLQVSLVAWYDYRPGLHYIYIDDQAVPFWLEVTGNPDNKPIDCPG